LIAPINQKLIQKHLKPSPLQNKEEEGKSKLWFYLLDEKEKETELGERYLQKLTKYLGSPE
jgi:hypothetical protein